MWKYRYRREYLPDADLVAQCNALGEEGWSIVGPPRWVPPEVSRSSAPGSVGVWACFFKRTISNREQAYERMHRETTPEEKAELAATVARWRQEDRK